MLAFFAIVFGVVFFDQLSKWLVVIFLKGNESAVIIKSVFQFTYLENRGAAFGMLSEHRWVFLVISTVALIGITVYMFKCRPTSKLAYVAVSFIVGGGIGNMIDRIWLGYVIDFIDFCAFPKIWSYVFNVADSFVCIGAGLLILYTLLITVDDIKKEKTKKIEVSKDENADE